MLEIPIRTQVMPCRLIEIIGAMAHALDTKQYTMADDQNRIVVKYFPNRLLQAWTDAYTKVRRREPVDYAAMPFATLMTHEETPRRAKIRAVEILMAAHVPLTSIVRESSNAELFGPHPHVRS